MTIQIKLLFSKLFFFLGDKLYKLLTITYKDKYVFDKLPDFIGNKLSDLYQFLMNLSVKLDKNCEIWKEQ